MTKVELAFSKLEYSIQWSWKETAAKEYDNVLACPGCGKILTGLHERSAHFQKILTKRAAKLWHENQTKKV